MKDNSEQKKRPDFNEWIEGKDGISCMKWPISEPKYLKNRLFWAFDAGRNCVWDQYIEKKQETEHLKSIIAEQAKEIEELKRELKKA